MNVFFRYAVLCVILILTSCTASTEDILDNNSSGNNAEGVISDDRRQIELLIRNNLVSRNYDTRNNDKIALNSENEIRAMDIYVFASETEYGKYTFQERLVYRPEASLDENLEYTTFDLVTSETDNSLSSAKISIKKGLFVKLYCVANMPELYVMEGGEYIKGKYTSMETTLKDNQVSISKEGFPTEEKFLSEYTSKVINPNNPEDVIKTPLLMSGSIPGSIDLTDYNDNTRINTNIKLMRGVVRFDVKNTSDKTNLIINSISMQNGSATTTIFPFKSRPDIEGKYITYPFRYFHGGKNDLINKGNQPAAFYSYAAPSDACLLLSGDYTAPSGEIINVNYKVPFSKLKDNEGNAITIKPNHRYSIIVNQASPYEVKVDISIADWDEGENLDDIKPDEDNASGMSELTTSTVQNIYDSYIYDNKAYYWIALYANTAREKFSVKLYSNAAIDCKMKFGDNDEIHKWLDVKCIENTAPTNTEWSKEFIYKFSVNTKAIKSDNNDKAFPPVLINFISTGGTTRVIRVESLTYSLDKKNISNANSYLSDNEYWYFDIGTNQWGTAITKCPEYDNWYLPTMNDYRNMFKVDDWNTKELIFNTTEYNNIYNSTIEKSVSSSYFTDFFSPNNYPSYPYMSCYNENDYKKPNVYNYSSDFYDYFGSSDPTEGNRARGIKLRTRTYSYTGCYRRQKYDKHNNRYYYEYYTRNGTGIDYTYMTYQTYSQTESRKYRCIKRRPGNIIYPY